MYEVVTVGNRSWCMVTGRAEVLGVIGRYETLEEAAMVAAKESLCDEVVDYDIEVRSDDEDDPAYGENGVIDYGQYVDWSAASVD